MNFFKKKKVNEENKKKNLSDREKKRLKKQEKFEKIEKRNERKEKLKNYDLTPFFGGMGVGIANIIPGVSGGTMLVIFNLFDKLMYAISDIFKRKTETRKESFILILKVLIGAAIGVVLFAKILGFTLKHFEVETIFWFVGLIIFSIPIIVKEEMKNEKFNIICFILGTGIIALLQYLNSQNPTNNINGDMNLVHLLSLVGLGSIGGATMIFPGVSGSMVLLVLGKYEMIRSYIDKITTFKSDIIIYLCFFAVGCVLGIILSAKLLTFLLKKHKSKIMSLILGFITASAIILPFNLENEITYNSQTICAIVASFTLGGALIYYINRLQNKKDF